MALVFENSLHNRVKHSIQPQRMGTKIDIEKPRKDSEMEKNQQSFFKNKPSDIFFACCGVLYILLHLSIPVIIMVNSISKEEKAIPAIKQINSNPKKLISIMNYLKADEDVTSLKKEPPVLQEKHEKVNLKISAGASIY